MDNLMVLKKNFDVSSDTVSSIECIVFTFRFKFLIFCSNTVYFESKKVYHVIPTIRDWISGRLN